MAKGSIIRALMRMYHSPAGKKYLASQKKKRKQPSKDTEQVYFRGKGFERLTVEARLRQAGLSEADIRSLKGKKIK